ncbi:unnamed protein product [Rotaria magnacalcarata]|uniref:Large ribosomal subunit protein bL21m n=2 Tax=Rotaria magnacalcarata TaxID=392030 RepID=A0A818ZSV7_9BILA|nr:unnamed protein product [Rotaria magnacalcarata]CAF4149265.1 unnamed protein product [Rotaria magnacalcarata]CAF4226398.1 unnamed protein product [Rotaria magnacalcarata]CAF4243235.1 unnamed protein product [Rotaria magnacalcarata]CAF5068186.1 unnamed protein product [Rotaria magnacalcarata]
MFISIGKAEINISTTFNVRANYPVRKFVHDNVHHDMEVQQLYTKVNNLVNDKFHQRLFAVIKIGDEQRKVTTEDIICKVDEFHPTIGDRIRFEKVLLVGSSDFTVVGRPILNPHFVRVEGIVIEKTLSQTQMEYWYAPRKKKVGARNYLWKDPLTMIRITNIELLGPIPGTNQSSSR